MGEEGSERVRAAYGGAKDRRLAALTAIYDPHNVLRVNQNIQPVAVVDTEAIAPTTDRSCSR
jgi:hypothetical protein